MAANLKTGYKKQAVPLAVRRGVAAKYGCPPGGTVRAKCHYCPKLAEIVWHCRSDGKPGYWVTFGGHEMDHMIPECRGGPTNVMNLVLACRSCNRSKGSRF